MAGRDVSLSVDPMKLCRILRCCSWRTTGRLTPEGVGGIGLSIFVISCLVREAGVKFLDQLKLSRLDQPIVTHRDKSFCPCPIYLLGLHLWTCKSAVIKRQALREARYPLMPSKSGFVRPGERKVHYNYLSLEKRGSAFLGLVSLYSSALLLLSFHVATNCGEGFHGGL